MDMALVLQWRSHTSSAGAGSCSSSNILCSSTETKVPTRSAASKLRSENPNQAKLSASGEAVCQSFSPVRGRKEEDRPILQTGKLRHGVEW